eukprot:CAMPEP_0113661712 /NCGR_PEP_ID=MMETSP0038_2-20120614/133_1 /TAXON_ID=2898 /ORGANISM="Cryptomonas paramecium" /LENGTH=251 /DNA_ID=CAMNT_0000576447 /DNA_START=17 /DNA_END=769 /DNA_ORIENTATION=+ /assembly_acc=CAM_ASM_000170
MIKSHTMESRRALQRGGGAPPQGDDEGPRLCRPAFSFWERSCGENASSDKGDRDCGCERFDQGVDQFFHFLERTYQDFECEHFSPKITRYVDGVCKTLETAIVVHRDAFTVAILYLQRLCDLGLKISQKSLNSLVLICIMMAFKEVDKNCPANQFWADCGGVVVSDIHRLEHKLLAALGSRLSFTPDELAELRADLSDFALRPAGERAGSAMARRFHANPSSRGPPAEAEASYRRRRESQGHLPPREEGNP